MAGFSLNTTSQHPFLTATVVDKVYGCIIGSALGDTIGLYTEFLSKHKCEKAYPTRKFRLEEPVTESYPDAHRAQFEPCGWTDDTDQALLILLAYLHIHTNDLNADLAQEFAARLRIWINRGLPALHRPAYDIGILVGSVAVNTCFLTDPLRCATDRWIKSSRNAAPNGSLMRTHPIGVIGINLSEEETWQLSVSVGRTTHADPRCVVACCITVGLIRGLLRGEVESEEDINKTIERAYTWVLKRPELMNPGFSPDLDSFQIRQHLERQEFEKHVYAESLDRLRLDDQGKIGYVYKCLGSAILLLRLAVRRISSSSLAVSLVEKEHLFEELIVALIMEGGDADTNGAAAGALVGAYLGYASLPSHWKLGLAHREWLMKKVERLAIAIGVIHGPLGIEWDETADGGARPANNGQ